MARPRKCRKVCCLPKYNEFIPADTKEEDKETIVLTVDEYEAVRLIDHEDFSQEECSEYMGVARTTVQQIYTLARKKLSQMLVDGKKLEIRGGQYQICDGKEEYCGCGGCLRHRRCKNMQNHEKEE